MNNQPTLQLLSCSRVTLEQASRLALTMNEPLRLQYDDGEVLAEVFFFRDQVLHAHANGLDGLRAFAALHLYNVRYTTTVGVWPARCTIIATWAMACREADLLRRRAPKVLRDDEVTDRLD